MKKCNCCNIEKDLSEFFKQNKKKSGYYSQCKSCTYAVQKKRRDYMLELVKRYKMKKGCEECGYKGHFAAKIKCIGLSPRVRLSGPLDNKTFHASYSYLVNDIAHPEGLLKLTVCQ